jgi:putative ABC transport system ATP-binding protein
MLELSGINKTFHQADGDVRVLVDLDFHLAQGKTAALLGESGSGKSTLLHIIAGLDHPDSGEMAIAGQAVGNFNARQWNAVRRHTLSLVFQQYHLVPTLTVDDNIMLQARLANRVDAKLRRQLVERLGLGSLLSRLPHQLSGGQQQRVAIARSLMHRPKLVLADEPTGNLDETTSQAVMALFVDLVSETGSSLLMVTHSAEMASFLDSRWQLHDGNIAALTEDS